MNNSGSRSAVLLFLVFMGAIAAFSLGGEKTRQVAPEGERSSARKAAPPAPGAQGDALPRVFKREKKDKPPNPLPAELVAAWEEAGAKFGWMRLNLVAIFMPPRPGLENEDGLVPAFSFAKWPEGKVGKLPQPERGFGLFLYVLQVSDKDLKDLAGMKSLLALDLNDARVTDAGLKTLAGLRSLEWLSLCNTKVTDGGLNELAGLTSLKQLNLDGTGVTAAGVHELKKKLPGLAVSHSRD